MAEKRAGDTSFPTDLFRHNTWANLRLLDFCASLNEEQLSASAVGTYGPIRNTLGHLIHAEVDYIVRATGKSPSVPIPTDRLLSFEQMKDAVRWAGGELAQLAVSARAENVVREEFLEEDAACEYPLPALLVQAINHSTEHRSQISTIITQLRLEPPEMDAWAWMVETGIFHEFHGNADRPARGDA